MSWNCFNLYRASGALYRIHCETDITELRLQHSDCWGRACATARTVRKHGKLIAKNVVFK